MMQRDGYRALVWKTTEGPSAKETTGDLSESVAKVDPSLGVAVDSTGVPAVVGCWCVSVHKGHTDFVHLLAICKQRWSYGSSHSAMSCLWNRFHRFYSLDMHRNDLVYRTSEITVTVVLFTKSPANGSSLSVTLGGREWRNNRITEVTNITESMLC